MGQTWGESDRKPIRTEARRGSPVSVTKRCDTTHMAATEMESVVSGPDPRSR